MNTRRTRSVGVLQSGQPLGMFATASAQFVQKRECPQGTRATPVRGAIRQTSHMSGVAVAAAAVTVAADVLKRAVSSFWLCEVRHFPGAAFSSPCVLVLHFPGLANSRPAIWSIIFQVLQFPVIVFLWSDIFRSCKFSAPSQRHTTVSTIQQ